MAAVDVGTRDNPPINDDLDDLFNYDVDNDIFQDVDTRIDVATKKGAADGKNRGDIDGQLGLDEEVKITKKRTPIPKLDEDRLLSQAGIPKLRKITKERLRFKGKGHEYNDIARMLTLYQLWLDDLYPRAKFADGLTMIEKLGHTKRMQVMRKEWINEGKAAREPREPDPHTESMPERGALDGDNNGPTFGAKPSGSGRNQGGPGDEDAPTKRQELSGADDSLFFSDDEVATGGNEADDLDAIFAEDEAHEPGAESGNNSAGIPTRAKQAEFADEEEAMADMDELW